MKKLWQKINQKPHKYINGTKGIISLFLCVMLLPMLTIGSALIEFSRYQGTVTVSREVTDMAALTTLAKYDAFLQDRFGLLALSQDTDVQKTYSEAFKQGTSLLGSSINQERLKTSAVGSVPLDNALKQQILDYGELTVLSEVLLEDLNLDKLLEQIEKLTQVTAFLEVMQATNAFLSSINDLVEEGNSLVEQIETIQTSAETMVTEVDGFCTDVYKLYEKIATGDGLPNFKKTEEVKEFVNSYKKTIEDIYERAEKISDSYETLSESIKNIYTSVTETFPTKLKDTKEKLAALKTATEKLAGNEKDKKPEKTEEGEAKTTVDLGEEILDSIEKSFNEAAKKLQSDLLSQVQEFADNIKSNIKENLGIPASWSKDYFTWPVSDEMLSDLKKLLSHIPSVWDKDKSEGEILDTLKEILLPSGFDSKNFMSGIATAFQEAIDNATDTFVNNIKDSLSKILSDLVAALRGMFNLEVFFDADLLAYVNLPETDSPWADVLNAIQSLFSAVDSLTTPESVGDWLGGFVKLYDTATQSVEVIMKTAEETAKQVETFIKYCKTPSELYKMLILSGYMTHNLSNRTTAKGQSLTGFDYSDVLLPDASSENNIAATLEGVLKILSGDSEGEKEFDEMFMGAELEYILAGTNSEIMNQVVVFMQTYMLRLIATVPALFTDASVGTMAAGTTIGAPIVYILVLLGDALVDTIFLVNGNEIPFIKTGCFLSPNGVDDLISQLKDLGSGLATEALIGSLEGMKTNTASKKDSKTDTNPLDLKDMFSVDYETHALLLLLITSNDVDITESFGKLVQLEASYYYKKNGGKTFDINKAYTAIKITNELQFNSFIDMFSFNDDSVLKGKFEYVRGY